MFIISSQCWPYENLSHKTIHTSLIAGFERGTYETQGHIDQALTNLIVVYISDAYLYTLNWISFSQKILNWNTKYHAEAGNLLNFV